MSHRATTKATAIAYAAALIALTTTAVRADDAEPAESPGTVSIDTPIVTTPAIGLAPAGFLGGAQRPLRQSPQVSSR